MSKSKYQREKFLRNSLAYMTIAQSTFLAVNAQNMPLKPTAAPAKPASAQNKSMTEKKELLDGVFEQLYKRVRGDYTGKKGVLSVNVLRRVVKEVPGSPAALSLVQMLIGSDATRPEACSVLRGYLRYHPDNLKQTMELAQILSWKRETWTESKNVFKKALVLDPSNLDALRNLANLSLWSGDRESYKNYLERYLRVKPSDEKVRLEFVHFLSQGKDSQSTKQAFSQMRILTKAKPNSPDLKLEAALLQFFMESKQTGFDQVVAIAKAYPILAHAEFTIGDKKANWSALAIAGELASWMDKRQESISYFREFLKHNPGEKTIQARLASILSWDEKDFPEALAIAKDLYRKDPNNVQAGLLIAQLQLSSGEAKAAYLTSQELLDHKHNPKVSVTALGDTRPRDLVYFSAILANASGQTAESIKQLKLYLETHSKEEDPYAELQYLQWLSWDEDSYDEATTKTSEIIHAQPELLASLPTSYKLWYSGLLLQQKQFDEAKKLLAEIEADEKFTKDADNRLAIVLTKANAEIFANNNDAGIEILRRAVAEYKTAKINFLLARELSYKPETREEALKMFSELLAEDTKNLDVLKAYGQALSWSGKFEDAKQVFLKVLESAPEDTATAGLLLETLYLQGKHEDSVKLARDLFQKEPKNPNFLYYLSDSLMRNGNSAEALKLLNENTDLVEQSKKLVFEKILLLCKSEQKEQKEQSYELLNKMISKLTPEDGLALLRLSIEHNELRDLAKYAGEELHKTGNHSPEMLRTLAMIKLWNENSRADAIILLKDHVDKTADINSRLLLAQAYCWTDQPDKAAHEFEIVLKEEPNNSTASKGLARSILWSEDPKLKEKATQIVERELNSASTDKNETKRLLAQSYESRKLYDKALALYKELHQETGESDDLANHARVLSWRGKAGQSKKEFKQIIAKEPENKAALLGLARSLHNEGRELAAESYLKKARLLYPDDPEVELESAYNFRTLGRFDKAMALVEKSIQHYQKAHPNSSESKPQKRNPEVQD